MERGRRRESRASCLCNRTRLKFRQPHLCLESIIKAALNYHTVITIGLYLSKKICTRVVSSREVGRDTAQAVLACEIRMEPLPII